MSVMVLSLLGAIGSFFFCDRGSLCFEKEKILDAEQQKQRKCFIRALKKNSRAFDSKFPR